MPDIIQPSPTGRAKCRGCGRTIQRDTLRFGEALPNAYAEGESLFWFHLPCAAGMRPEKLLAALESSSLPIAERAWLEDTARGGLEHPRLQRLARVERATSGRAHCRECHELIAKGALRIALQIFEDGRFSPLGTIHVECAGAYFGTVNLLERLRALQDLDETWLPELQAGLGALPPLAKTHPLEEELASAKRSTKS